MRDLSVNRDRGILWTSTSVFHRHVLTWEHTCVSACGHTRKTHAHTHTEAEVEEVVRKPGCMWWLTPVIPAFRRLRNKSEASLGYKVRL